MSREIKFRGKLVDGGGWVYGSLERRDHVDRIGGYVITPPTNSDPAGDSVWTYDQVIRETVGQFSGLEDSKGNGIYEGDIVETDGSMSFSNHDSGPGSKREIYVLPTGYCGVRIGNVFDKEVASSAHVWNNYQLWNIQRSLTIIGNIHDTPSEQN